MSNTQYAQLAGRLGVARRAYKRAGAMAGAVVFLIEALGTAAIVIAADVLFDLGTGGRVALFSLGVAAMVYFAFRHILKPLGQHITDQQMALYLEQRNPQFEGSLIAATEFGQQHYSGRVAQIVDSILDQAVDRAGRFDLKRAIDLSRLRKYGVVALVLIGVYVMAAVTMPERVSRRFARVFTPWKPLPKDAEQPNTKPPELAPIELIVAQEDSQLVRGGTMQLQASTSRSPKGQVSFHFRSAVTGAAAGGEWKMINMGEVEKLNTYQMTLPDINEDLEFFVSAENAKSTPHRVTVFDPLLIKSYEVAIKYPAYLKFNETTDKPATPDITAVVGSTVTLKTIANGPVAAGQIAWDGGATLAGTANADTLTATFDVKESGSFRINLTDAHGQKVETPTPSSLTAITDRMPTVKQTSPTATVSTHPMGEIAFIVELADDLALEDATLVVTRTLDPNAQPVRIPLHVDGKPEATGGIIAARGTVILSLEELKPAIKVGDILSCYVETRDRKGQTGLGDLIQVLVGSFESWAYYSTESHSGAGHMAPELEPVVMAAWRIHRTKNELAPNEFNKQLNELAATMVDATGALQPYFDPKMKSPEQIKHGEAGMKLAKLGQEQLKAHDSEKAVNLLRAALAELTAAGMGNNEVVMPPPPASAAAGQAMKSEISKLTAMVQQPAGGADATRTEKEKAAEDADAVAKANEIEKDQAKVAEAMKGAAAAPDNKAKNDANADEQEKVAKKADAAAKDIKAKAGNDENKKAAADALAGAAAKMKEAAKDAKAGKKDDAAKKSDEAKKQIADAKGKLQAGASDNADKALDKADAAVAAAGRKQAEIADKTDKADKATGKDKKDQANAAAGEQVKLNKELKDLKDAIDGLAKAGDAGGLKPDTNKHVQNAKKELNKAGLEAKVGNAAVLLAAGDTGAAKAEQEKIKKAIEKVGDAVKNAGATRAGDAATALKKAKDDAASAKKNLKELAEGKGPAGAEKKDTAQKTADQLDRLARQLNARDFGGGNKQFDADASAVKDAVKDAKLADKLEAAKDEAAKLAKVTERLSNQLEAAYESQLKSKELFAAQREECPPAYRPLVNKYFETIGSDQK